MGVVRNYFISIFLVILLTSLFYSSLYDLSTASDKVMFNVTNSMQSNIDNRTNDIKTILEVETQIDPNNPADLTVYFAKSLAVGGRIVSLITTLFVSSLSFVFSIVSNLTSLPAPFNVLGGLVLIGMSIFTVILVLSIATLFTKVDY